MSVDAGELFLAGTGSPEPRGGAPLQKQADTDVVAAVVKAETAVGNTQKARVFTGGRGPGIAGHLALFLGCVLFYIVFFLGT